MDDVVDVLLEWRGASERRGAGERSVVGVRRLRRGDRLTVGDRGDLVVPLAEGAAERAELVRHGGRDVTVFVPGEAELRVDGVELRVDVVRGARLWTLPRGARVEVAIGPCVVYLKRSPADARFAAPTLGWPRGVAGYVAGSAALHVAIFAAAMLIAPSLRATEEDPFDPDRLALIQHLLDASAARDIERAQAVAASDAEGKDGAKSPEGSPRQASSQGSGTEARFHANARLAGRQAGRDEYGPHATEPPLEEGARARERRLAAAAQFGLVGILARSTGARSASSAWQSEATGDDRIASIFDERMGEAPGWADVPVEGGGGRAGVMPLDGFAGGQGGPCTGGAPCNGVGRGRGRLGGGHRPAVIGLGGGGARCPEDDSECATQVNGRLPPEVIQRVVRENEGRFRACYEDGLRTNPALTGRVAVKFAIDRTGAVSVASDGGSDLPDGKVRRCVISAFTRLSFPAPEGGVVMVIYPIVFSPA